MKEHKTYETFSFEAGAIKEGFLDRIMKEKEHHGFTINASHTVRTSSGDDLLVIIFEKSVIQ
jgi:hypothetical protein